MRFKIGDKVRIKGKNWYGHRKKWIIEFIFKNGDMRLRNAKDEGDTVERYEQKDLKKGWKL